LDDLRAIIATEDWDDHAFSRQKAYACAILSELAYWHIPSFELGTHDNVKLVPSSAYQELQRRLIIEDFYARMLTERELAVTVLDRRLAVVIILKTNSVIFVAVRGTAYLYDWLVNANVLKCSDQTDGGRFHRGFYLAARDFCTELTLNVAKYDPSTPVYLTGHSLGGARTAIMHATWNWCPHCREMHSGWEWSHSAYTFGMPRYANTVGVTAYRCPYHVLKVGDMVPRVPPESLGYANSNAEYELSGKALKRVSSRDVYSFAVWIARLARRTAITEHFIEGDRAALAH